MEEIEQWKTMEYYSKYQISNFGSIKHIERNEIIKGSINGDGYAQVSLYPDNNDIGLGKKPLRIHRLVAKLFCFNDDQKKNIVNHMNGNKLDNRSINLEWTTTLENTRHAAKNNLLKITNHRAVMRICPKTKETKIYESITKAFEDNEDVLKYDTYIINACNRTQKTAGGFIWNYVSKTTITNEPDGKEIDGYKNYIITNTGEIYSKSTKKFLKPSLNGGGYHVIDLHGEYDETKEIENYTRKRNMKRKKFRVHYLVAKHYIENNEPERKTEVNHKDKNRINNNVENLEWVSSKENLQHAHNKKVYKYKGNELVENYESILEASTKNDINPKTLSSMIKNKTVKFGFSYQFEKL